MFCKSRSGWVNMPGGLLQSVVCDEAFDNNDSRIDEVFYNTIVAVRDRLQSTTEVFNPTDTSISLLSAKNHYDKMSNWLSRLSEKIGKLDVLFRTDCNQEEAYAAWYSFFNHSFWSDISESVQESFSLEKSFRIKSIISYRDTEEYIEDQVSCINDKYNVKVQVKVEANGIRQQLLGDFLRKYPMFRSLIPKGLHIDFYATTDCPNPDAIWWKVRNVGEYAEMHDKIRGQNIKNAGSHRREYSKFAGPHFVECYIIKNNECVAITKIHVKIGEASL